MATQLVLLGTGTPNAEPDRMGSSLAVCVEDQPYIVDCGPGVVRRANEAFLKLGIPALEPKRLDLAFLTHFHTDHTVGLPDLIYTPWVLGRSKPLRLFGPSGTARMADHLEKAYARDVDVRLHGGEPANPTGMKVNPVEIHDGWVFEDSRVRITAFGVKHGACHEALGYKFESQDRTIVVSGDTSPSERLVEIAKGCDVLVHEVYSAQAHRSLPEDWQAYHRQFHTSALQLAELCQQVQPGDLVLTHQLYWGASRESVVQEVRSLYSGRVHDGQDLMVI